MKYADIIKTRQILLNLLSNAAKLTERGTIGISIEKVTDENSKIPNSDFTVRLPARVQLLGISHSQEIKSLGD